MPKRKKPKQPRCERCGQKAHNRNRQEIGWRELTVCNACMVVREQLEHRLFVSTSAIQKRIIHA